MSFDPSQEPEDKGKYTEHYNNFYSRFALVYDWLIKALPIWRNWIGVAIPWIRGPKVLEASFGTGYLLTQYAGQFETYGIDFNHRLAQVAKENLRQSDLKASLQVANVESLPFADVTFDTVVNTMALTGYPDGQRALAEITMVLRPGGRFVMVDINYPRNGNKIGTILTKGWKISGDIIRDVPKLLERFGYEYMDQEVGGFGSVHLYVATKSGLSEV
jgi:ubiquinone/menaquinone biosynthesis C-methylase UbiE